MGKPKKKTVFKPFSYGKVMERLREYAIRSEFDSDLSLLAAYLAAWIKLEVEDLTDEVEEEYLLDKLESAISYLQGVGSSTDTTKSIRLANRFAGQFLSDPIDWSRETAGLHLTVMATVIGERFKKFVWREFSKRPDRTF